MKKVNGYTIEVDDFLKFNHKERLNIRLARIGDYRDGKGPIRWTKVGLIKNYFTNYSDWLKIILKYDENGNAYLLIKDRRMYRSTFPLREGDENVIEYIEWSILNRYFTYNYIGKHVRWDYRTIQSMRDVMTKIRHCTFSKFVK